MFEMSLFSSERLLCEVKCHPFFITDFGSTESPINVYEEQFNVIYHTGVSFSPF